MALARTNVGTTVKAPGAATSVTTAAFTPADNSLVVVVATLQSSNNSLLPSISGGGLTWTKQLQAGPDPQNFGHFTILWTAPVTTGASMTVTVGNMPSDGTAEGVVHVFTYTGYNTSTPVGATITGTVNTNSSAFSMTLNAAPATTSEVLAGFGVDTGGGAAIIVAGTGWTQQFHLSDTQNVDSQTQTRTGSVSTAVLWNAPVGGYDGSAVAAEIVAAATGGAPTGWFSKDDTPIPRRQVFLDAGSSRPLVPPAFAVTPATDWMQAFDERPVKRPILDFPRAPPILVPPRIQATWSSDDPLPRRRPVQPDPGPFQNAPAAAVAASPTGWLSTTDVLPRRIPLQPDPGPFQNVPTTVVVAPSTGWLGAADDLPKKLARQADGGSLPVALPPQSLGWLGFQEDYLKRPARPIDQATFSFAVPTQPTGWLAAFDQPLYRRT